MLEPRFIETQVWEILSEASDLFFDFDRDDLAANAKKANDKACTMKAGLLQQPIS